MLAVLLQLMAQINLQISDLTNELSGANQKLQAVQRLYEAEAAVASQAAEHSKRDSDHMARLEGRLAEALALSDAAEQDKEQMQHQLHEAQVRAYAELIVVNAPTCSCFACEGL